jgi:hypothetical protein
VRQSTLHMSWLRGRKLYLTMPERLIIQ